MDSRNLYQFQVGFSLFQLEEGPGDSWPPTWPDENILAWLKLRVWGTGSVDPELNLRGPTYGLQARMRSDQFILSAGDADTGQWLMYCDSGYVRSTTHFGAYLFLYSGQGGSYIPYAGFSPGLYNTLGMTWPPFFRLTGASFILSGTNGTGTGGANLVPPGSALIYWDDTNHVLKAIDNGGTTYTIGP